MPSDTLSLTVGTGLGVSVLAGIISGVCFVIGYKRIQKKRETKWHCAVCNKYFRSPEFILGEDDFVICSKCERKVCKSTCSSIQNHTSWICRTCSETSTNWIDGALKAVEPITKAFYATMGLDNDLPDELEEDLRAEEVKKKEQVRTFIERLVNNLLEDNIDDASINEIYNDKKYRRMFEKYHRDISGIITDLGTSLQISLSHLPIVGESPCSAHSALKRIIQKIIREANDLPKLKNIEPSNSLNPENRTYEDLLSTAILNKIISSSQNNNSVNSSRANSVCSRRSSSSRRRKLQKEYFFGEETLHNKKKWRNDTDTASVSSLEEWVHSDSSRGSTKYVDRVSLTIKQRIEEVSTSDSDAAAESEENDEAEYLNFKSAFGDVEPNWFLQKRQFMGSCSPVPVSMLVPDPTKEAKVFIGDKEIEDTSDLSDVPSDYEEHNDSLPSVEVSNHLIETKNLIGGKNSLADFCSSHYSDDEVSADSGVKECKYMDEIDTELLSTSNKDENKFVADESHSSDGSNTERDTEYTEKYGTIPRRISISPKSEELQEKTIIDSNKHIEESKQLTNDLKVESEEDETSEFTGVYSRREKEKWSHAVELKNNPYSKENIEKRIKCRNSLNSLFGSDYYIRQATIPSGTKKIEEIAPNVPDETDHHHTEQHQEHVIALNEIVENAPEKIQKSKLLLMARPFNTTENEKQNTSQPLKSSEPSSKGYDLGLHFASEISSDSEVSLVNCYDVTESVVYKKVSMENEEIQSAEKYFDFESLETSLNHVEKIEEQIEQLITKPIEQANYEQPVATPEIQTVSITPEFAKPVELKHAIDEYSSIPPYVITKRSDNTLIKKIYSDPSVRSFALSRRNKLRSTVEVLNLFRPNLTYQISSEVSKPSAMRQYSWDNRETSETNETKPKSVKSCISMDDYSKQKLQFAREPFSKHEKSPELLRSSEKEKYYSTNNKETTQNNLIEAKSEKEKQEIDLKKHQEESSANCDKFNSDCEALEEIDKLKKQKLVANRLREISKSTFDLSSGIDRGLNKMFTINKVDKKDTLDWRNGEANGKRERSSSVRDLRKKFEKFDAEAKTEHPILHSLTGRSLSKQFKEKLRDTNEDIPSLSQIHSLSLTNLEVEDSMR